MLKSYAPVWKYLWPRNLRNMLVSLVEEIRYDRRRDRLEVLLVDETVSETLASLGEAASMDEGVED